MATIKYNPRNENDHFYYVEGSCSVENFLKEITKVFCIDARKDYNRGIKDNYSWELVYPKPNYSNEATEEAIITDLKTTIEGITDKAIYSTVTEYGKKFYFKIEMPENMYHYCIMSISDKLNEDGSDFLPDPNNTNNNPVTGKPNQLCSPPGKFSWYTDKIDKSIKEWLPLSYYLNIEKNAINLIVRGDPSADTYPYDKYLLTYAYIGCLKPVEADQVVDDVYNFGITLGSYEEPNFTNQFGPRTGNGITDVCMIGNKIGMPYQPHYIAYYTPNPTMDKLNIEGSRWNNQKHQFSDITVIHSVDMERGKMRNVLVGDNSALYDNDKLVFKQYTKEQEMYRKFLITAPYSFINNSANVQYCLAIRCYNDDLYMDVDDPNGIPGFEPNQVFIFYNKEPRDIECKISYGAGINIANGILEVSLGTEKLILNQDYTINNVKNVLIIKKEKLLPFKGSNIILNVQFNNSIKTISSQAINFECKPFIVENQVITYSKGSGSANISIEVNLGAGKVGAVSVNAVTVNGISLIYGTDFIFNISNNTVNIMKSFLDKLTAGITTFTIIFDDVENSKQEQTVTISA